jgi:hypothetical protein
MSKINRADNKKSLVYRLFVKAEIGTGWDRFLEEGSGMTWDYVIETDMGDPTPEEKEAIMNADLYGRPIDQKSIDVLKSGGTFTPESDFGLTITAEDGTSEKYFKTKEELINFAKQYPGYQKGENYWVTDNGQNLEAHGVTFDEIFNMPSEEKSHVIDEYDEYREPEYPPVGYEEDDLGRVKF